MFQMKKLLFSIFSMLLSNFVFSQQWIDKKYVYDSTLNVVYGTAINFNGGIDTLKLDLYQPICDDSKHISKKPLMIVIHGGAFLAGDKNETTISALCRQFAKRGYVTASINYRLGFIADEAAWSCNYPNYSCVFATDSAEWHRALYRGIQDGKGALRFLVNRKDKYRIDTEHIFVTGESAGAFVALGMALLDVDSERPSQTYQLPNVLKPNNNTASCIYNLNKTFPNNTLLRPDLGGIEGNIEPSTQKYTIKGVGNFYGAVTSNLLKLNKVGTPKPAIYSFHQPCDLIVPIDSGMVYQGLSWCFTNGYNCNGIKNTAKLYGSRTINHWNTKNSYGYTMQSEFTSTAFPNSFLFGTGSCVDQVNNPCHAYDNFTLRETNLAKFFANFIQITPICEFNMTNSEEHFFDTNNNIQLFPNPTQDVIELVINDIGTYNITIFDLLGKIMFSKTNIINQHELLDFSSFPDGIYSIKIANKTGIAVSKKVVKH
jgi:hypothetical protein